MPQNNVPDSYRKNRLLIITFISLISFSLVTGLFFGYKYSQNIVYNNFNTNKVEILEEATKYYNEFIFNKIPEISLYQGFLDSLSFQALSDSFYRKYPFIDKISFYDIEISNHLIENGFSYGDKNSRLSLGINAIYETDNVDRNQEIRTIFKKQGGLKIPTEFTNSFARLVIKFVDFVVSTDKDVQLSNSRIFDIFYTFNPLEVSYLNVPRSNDFNMYKKLMVSTKTQHSYIFDQDLLTFHLNPNKMKVTNLFPKLYENVMIKPLVFDSLSSDPEYMTTGIALPGSFSESQIYLIATKKFLNKNIIRLFEPIALAIIGIYVLLMVIGILIYRNLDTNSKLFKLQYDFINNLTHEFKTPVSVIKIAGNNIRNASDLSEYERIMYGKILDEEADKLNDLMNRLLSLTQIENKSIRLKYEEIDLEKFCSDMVHAYLIKYPEYVIQYEVDKNIGYFECDKVILTSIFQNLMNNAYKYSLPDRKELNIKIRKMKHSLFIQFIDKGIGIPKNEIENIFKKFYRIETEYNQQGSAGIGLAFCKEIINFMNGEIKVRSKVGQGSEFRITLPLEK